MAKQSKAELRQRVLQEIISNLPPEEAKQLQNMDEYQIRVRILEYYQSRHPNQSNNIITGSYNMDGAKADYALSFSPTLMARSSLLYLQSLASLQFPSTHFTTRRDMKSYLLLQTQSGSGYFEYEGVRRELFPGDIIFLDCRKPHHYQASGDGGWGYRLAHFDGVSMIDLYHRVVENKCFFFPEGQNRAIHMLMDKLVAANAQESEDQELISNCLLVQIVTELLLKCPSIRQETPEWIKNICAYLEQHHHETIALDIVAKEFNLSKYYMCHAFKRYMGETVQQYITNKRMHSAEELLRYTKLSVAEIALLVGFENASSFGKVFHKKAGITPGAYRKQWKLDE